MQTSMQVAVYLAGTLFITVLWVVGAVRSMRWAAEQGYHPAVSLGMCGVLAFGAGPIAVLIGVVTCVKFLVRAVRGVA